MGQKAKNAGKKQSKVSDKLADSKSVSHNFSKKEVREKIIRTREYHNLDIAINLPENLCDKYKNICDDMWGNKSFPA